MLQYSESKRSMNRPPSSGRGIENRSKSSSDLGKSLVPKLSADEIQSYNNNYMQLTEAEQIEANINRMASQSSFFALGWGRNYNGEYPAACLSGVVEAACGEKHTLFVKDKFQLYGCGDNTYGQLGLGQQEYVETATPIFRENSKIVSNVFSGPYHSFFITSKGEVWGTGMNNRGQLGIGNDLNQKIPVLVESLSPNSGRKLSARQQTTSRGRIVTANNILTERQTSNERVGTYQYTPEKRSASKLVSSTDKQIQSLLEQGQYVKNISCGPFHSLVLTTRGRVFASGIKYHTDFDQYATEFNELRLRVGQIEQISCGTVLSGVLTNQGRVYVWGVLGKRHLADPTLVETKHVIQISLGGESINLCLNSKGQVYQLEEEQQGFLDNSHTKSVSTAIIRCRKVDGLPFCKQIHTGVGFGLAVTESRQVFGWGSNRHCELFQKETGQKTITKFETPIIVKNAVDAQRIICGSYHVIGLYQRQPISRDSQANILSSKDLQLLESYKQENEELKNSLKKKKEKRAVKVQTDPMTKFDMQVVGSGALQPRTFSTSLEIPFSQLVLQKQISQGGYGIIYRAKWRQSVVAVKLFKIDNSETAMKDFLSQCHAMEALRHPNIVMFLGACTKPPHLAIVLEYCSKGTLWSILQSSVDLSWEDKRRFALDTARGMNYLHSCEVPILHRDLKSLNLLLDESYRVKLADFGWTKGLENYMTSKIGTYQWMAPEVISGQKYSQKADVFSFAIILWEIASRQPPYRNVSGLQVSIEVANNDLRPNIPKKTPQAFARLIKRCWDRNPDLRPSFREIIKQLEVIKLA